jgi:hypothetical protein
MSANGRARPIGRAVSTPLGPADLDVRIGRLVIDRAALADTSVRGLHEAVVQRIVQRLASAVEPEQAPRHRPDLSDAIATAVAEQVSPQLDRARLTVRLKADTTRRR